MTKYLERFHQEIKSNPKLLQETVEKYFLVRMSERKQRTTDLSVQKNNHKLVATMNIDEDYAEKKKKKESELCQQLIAECEDKQSIYQKGLELQKRQSAPQNVDILPTLSIGDIEKKVIRTPIIQGHTGTLPIAIETHSSGCFSFLGSTYVQLCEQPTNGMTYFRCLLNTFDLPNELKPYLPLFVNILTR